MTPAGMGSHSSGQRLTQESGEQGIRDRVLVLPSVICSQLVADRVAEAVPGAVSAPHDHGCAQIGEDNAQTERTLRNTAANPNVSGAVVIGLGCEHVQSDALAASIETTGTPVRELSIQGVGGTEACMDRAIAYAEALGEDRGDRDRPELDLGSLTIGIVSTDLTPSTVERAEPLVGEFVDRIVEAGGRVILAGTERFTPFPEDLQAYSDGSARNAFEELAASHPQEFPRVGRVQRLARQRSFEELATPLGTQSIRSVLSYGETPTHEQGLSVLAAPSSFAEAATGLAAAGAQLIVHLTGEGITSGHPVVPVFKLTGDSELFTALEADIDLDANRTDLDGLVEAVTGVVDGVPTAAERHGVSSFAITRIGPSM